jgi:hypothetical protein
MRTDKKHYVYLSGSITSDPRTFQWRTDFENLIDSRGLPVVVQNPCRSKYDQNVLKRIMSGQKVDHFRDDKKLPFGVLKRKDRQMIRICSLIVVNLKIINKERPPIGTIYELAWADELRLPVIAIIGEDQDDIFASHPFIIDSYCERVPSVEEAVNVIDEFFVEV